MSDVLDSVVAFFTDLRGLALLAAEFAIAVVVIGVGLELAIRVARRFAPYD